MLPGQVKGVLRACAAQRDANVRLTVARHLRFDAREFRWVGIDPTDYKPGGGAERGMGWNGITRHALGDPAGPSSAFALRYFELAPGGYSSFEKHRHVHLIVALRGRGRGVFPDAVIDLEPFDALYVAPLEPHRWVNDGEEPFGFLCPVDAARDRPAPLGDAEWEALRANPVTAPYAS